MTFDEIRNQVEEDIIKATRRAQAMGTVEVSWYWYKGSVMMSVSEVIPDHLKELHADYEASQGQLPCAGHTKAGTPCRQNVVLPEGCVGPYWFPEYVAYVACGPWYCKKHQPAAEVSK